MVDEHKELVFNWESEHCVFSLGFNGRVPGGRPLDLMLVDWGCTHNLMSAVPDHRGLGV